LVFRRYQVDKTALGEGADDFGLLDGKLGQLLHHLSPELVLFFDGFSHLEVGVLELER